MRAGILVGLILASSSVLATDYALVVGGGSNGAKEDGTPTAHDFAGDLYRTAKGLSASNWQTTLLFSPEQGPGRFKESDALHSLKGVAVEPASKASLLERIAALAQKIGPSDKVYLSIGAHGSSDRNGSFVFGLVGPRGMPESVTAAELKEALLTLKRTGAKIAVNINSCFSGNFPPEFLKALRADTPDTDPRGRGVCLITSSVKDGQSEACMPGDFDKDGKLISPYNKSYTSTDSFIAQWLYEKAGPAQENPFGKDEGRCFRYQKQSFDECVKQAAKRGLTLAPGASLKEVFRVGRFCDQTANLPDSTGDPGVQLPALSGVAQQALAYTYGHGVDWRRSVNQLDPHGVPFSLEGATKAVEKFAGNPAAGDYARALSAGLQKRLAAYRENLVVQKNKLDAYHKIAYQPLDPKALPERLSGSLKEAVQKQFDAENDYLRKMFDRINEEVKKKGGSPQPYPDPTTFQNAHRTQLIYTLQQLYNAKSLTPEDRQGALQVIGELTGGAEGAQLQRDIIEAQDRQHQIFEEIIGMERRIYDEHLGRAPDSCSDFTF